MPRIAHIEIRSDPPQVAGSVVRYIIPPDERGPFEATYALGGESRATLTLPTDAAAWEHVSRMGCLRVVYEDGTSRSWRIADDSLSDDERTGELVLSACEILLDLGDVRVLRNDATEGAPQLARTYAVMTPTEILSDVLRELHDAGEALHIRLGVIEPTALIAHDRTWATALEVVRAVASHPQVACEYRLREEADAFYLDLVARVGADAAPVHLWYQGDLGSLVRQRSSSQMASVVIPRGNGDVATCGAAVFEVVAVNPSYIRVRDPDAPGAPVIVFDNQFAGSFVVRPVDGAPLQVTSSSVATQDLYLAAGASSFVVGDLFELRRDAAGNRLVTRSNPLAVRPRHLGGIGRVERIVSVDAEHTMRNYVVNGFFRDWKLIGDGSAYGPVGWSTGAINARRDNVPGAPAGVSALLRPTNAITVSQQMLAGSRELPNLFSNSTDMKALARPGEVWEIRNVTGNALRHTVTITSADRAALTWAEPTPETYAANQVRLVQQSSFGVSAGGIYLSPRIYPPRDVKTFTIGAYLYSPTNVTTAADNSLGSPRGGLVSLQYRKNGGAWQRVAAKDDNAWQVLSFDGFAHSAGAYYDVRVVMESALGLFANPAPSRGFGEIQWVYFGEGSALPPHDMLSGAFAIPEYSGANRLHRRAQAALLEMSPERASYQVRLMDLGRADGSAVPADRLTLGGTVWLHHDRLERAMPARLLTMTDPEDSPEAAQLTLDSAEPDVARTLALLLGSRDAGAAGGGGTAAGPWPVTVEATPYDGGLVSGGGRYVAGQVVELQAVPQSSWVFKRWTEGGVAAGSTPSLLFVASKPRALVAEFEFVPSGNYTITTGVTPVGRGTVTGGGVYAAGATVTLVATPSSGWSFKRWTESGIAVPGTFTAAADRTIVAEFEQTPVGSSTVSLSASPGGGGSVSGGGTFPNGTAIQVSATPAAGFVFSRWTEGGSAVSTSPQYVFTVAGARTLVAEFASTSPGPWTIGSIVSPGGSGVVYGVGSYANGATVTLTATPSTGYVFKRWTVAGSAVSINSSYSFPATADRTVVAEFEAAGPWTISAGTTPASSGDVIGLSSPYAHGATVSLTAAPFSGRSFLRWTEGGVTISTSPSLAFTATRDRALVAEFITGEPV